jgi:hypothetical protein
VRVESSVAGLSPRSSGSMIVVHKENDLPVVAPLVWLRRAEPTYGGQAEAVRRCPSTDSGP